MGTVYVLNSHPNNRTNAHFKKIGGYFPLLHICLFCDEVFKYSLKTRLAHPDHRSPPPLFFILEKLVFTCFPCTCVSYAEVFADTLVPLNTRKGLVGKPWYCTNYRSIYYTNCFPVESLEYTCKMDVRIPNLLSERVLCAHWKLQLIPLTQIYLFILTQ